jgi:hypothetical protein
MARSYICSLEVYTVSESDPEGKQVKLPSFHVYLHIFLEFLSQNLIILPQINYGEVIHMFPRGPYSFCGVWRVFVQLQFRTRYSGHTLSRLAEIRHNKTKQSRFPTTRRKSLKSWAT